jgi:hypothetical protein
MIFSKKKKILSAMLSLAMIGTMVASVPFTASADATTTTVEPGVSYSVQGQSYGWSQGYKADGVEAGTEGKSKRVEALKVKLTNAPGASITYQVHGQSYGWTQSAKSDDVVAGTVGKGLRVEALKVSLKGLTGYSVSYRVYQQSYAWSAWQTTKNGTDISAAAVAGVEGKSKRVEAIEIKIVKDPVTTLSVSSVAAVTAQTLKVTFSGAVADTSKYSFKVVRGTTTLTDLSSNFTATWSADKTYATLDFGASIPANTYTVTAASTGTDLSTTANSATVVVAAQAVTKISIVSKSLIRWSTTTPTYGATLSYKIFDQYGTDITSTISTSLLSVSAVVGSKSYAYPTQSGVNPISISNSTGVITLTNTIPNTTSDFATTDTTGVVTIVYATNGVNTSATMNLVAAASVGSVTFGANILPTGYTAIQAGLSTAVTIPITVVDQYGNSITDTTALASSLKLISSDSSYVLSNNFSFVNDANGNAEISVDTTGLSKAETVVLTLVNTTTGTSWTKSIDIVMASTPTKIAVGDFTTATVAASDSFALPITVTDQFGTTLTKAQIASNATTIKTWVTDGGFTVGGNTYHIDIDPSSSTYGELIGTVTATAGTYVITLNSYVSNSTLGNLVTKTVTVSDARIGTYVSNYGSINLMQGATKDLEFSFKDQYNAAIAYGNLKDNIGTGSTKIAPDYDDYSYTATLSKLSGDTGSVYFDTTSNNPDYLAATPLVISGANVAHAADLYVKSLPQATGSYKLTVAIMDGSTTVSSSTATINVVKNNVTGLKYSIEDIATLNGSTSEAASSTNAYAKQVVIDAKDASGNSYVVSQGDVLSVKSSDAIAPTLLSAAGITAAGTGNSLPILNIAPVSGDWYVAGNNIKTNVTSPVDQTATITVLLNTQDGIQTLTKTVKVSCAAPSIATVNAVTAAIDSTAVTGNTSYVGNQATDVSKFTTDLGYAYTGETSLTSAAPAIFVIGEDQYGVWSNLDGGSTAYNAVPTVYANTTTLANYNGFSIVSNKLEYPSNAATLKNGTIIATVTALSGASKQITIVVSGLDRTAPTAPLLSKLSVTDNTTTTKDTLVGTAGAVENSATVKVYSDSALTTLVGSSATAASDGSFSYTLTDASSGTLTYYVVAVDAAGNVSSATTVSYTATK